MSYGTQNNSIRRSAAFMKSVLLVIAIAIAAPAAERSQSEPQQASPTQELSVSSNLTDQEVEPTFALTFTPNRALPATEGRLAVLIWLALASGPRPVQMDPRRKWRVPSLATPTGQGLFALG